MEETPLLSVCMIVRDEEKRIEQCLESVRAVADETIVVDTGSTDRTEELCRRRHVNLFEYAWTGSFADARNFGLDKAAGRFILWLDADEVLDAPDAAQLRHILERTDQDILPVPLVNFMGEKPDEHNAYLFTSHRVFRASRHLRFTGRIHERLDLNGFSGNIAAEKLPARILHYGYMDDVVRDKHKSARNLAMLREERSGPERTPWTDYHLASEYYRLKKYPEAFECANTSIRAFLQAGKLPPSLVYKLKYDILLAGGRYDAAWPGIEKAIELYPDYVDLHFYKGLILLAKARYDRAALAFSRCLLLGDGRAEYLTLRGTGSFYALYYLGVCYEHMGRTADSKEAYVQALSLCPGYGDAARKLNCLPAAHEDSVQPDSGFI